MSRVSLPVIIFALVSLLIVLSGFLFLSYERKSVEPNIIKAPTAQATLTWRKMYKSGYGSYLIVSHQNIGTYEASVGWATRCPRGLIHTTSFYFSGSMK